MQHSSSCEANPFAASKEIPRILWKTKVHYCIHKRQPPVSILSQAREEEKNNNKCCRFRGENLQNLVS